MAIDYKAIAERLMRKQEIDLRGKKFNIEVDGCDGYYRAYDKDTYDGGDSIWNIVGTGETKREALLDLLEKMAEAEIRAAFNNRAPILVVANRDGGPEEYVDRTKDSDSYDDEERDL